MPINQPHKDYAALKDTWAKIANITDQKNVADYLVELNPTDLSPENVTRNKQYKERAIFYAISGLTVLGMIGSIFRKVPVVEVAPELEYLKANADGSGLSIYQLSQAASKEVLRNGRAGLSVTFPKTEGAVSKADMVSGKIAATMHIHEPDQVVNWHTRREGSRVVLDLVVLSESIEVSSDGYTSKTEDIFREMFLTPEGVYGERIWRKVKEVWTAGLDTFPTDAKNQPWSEIPFSFIGSENNDTNPDNPPMLGIVELNIGHYRNSADYEDSVWFSGQAQPWMSGVTQEHLNLLKANNLYVGSRNLIGVPAGEQFGFAQASPNPLVRQAMVDKLEGMVAMGARLMQQGSATKTATQAGNEQEAQTSRLGMVASNVSEAFSRGLVWCARYMGAKEEGNDLALSQDFVNLTASPQEIQQIVAGFVQGAIPPADYIRWMKKQELFTDEKTDDEYLSELPVYGGGL